jgi:hypothetical protein
MKRRQIREAFHPRPLGSSLAALFILVPLLFPVFSSGWTIFPGFQPYLDLSWDAGRDNDEYYFDKSPPGTTLFMYRGVSVQPGIRYQPHDWPAALDFSVLKGFAVEPMFEYVRYARPGIYAAMDAVFATRPSRGRTLSAEVSYLNDVLQWNHSVLAGDLQGTVRTGMIAWSALAGGAWEFRRFSGFKFDRPLVMGAAQVAFHLWFIRPYANAGFVWRLTQGPYDGGPWVHPSWSSGFVSLGLQFQPGPADLAGLIHRMTAPMLWWYGGPE